MEAATCADAFTANWVARFGVPARLTSDQGRQFMSELWRNLCSQLGIEQLNTTAYHPQSNGMVERAHLQLKNALKARLAGVAWPEHLPWVLLGLRSAPKEDSGISSAELVYLAPLTLPGQLAADLEAPLEPLIQRLRRQLPPPVRHGGNVPPSEPPEALISADTVYVRRGGALPPLTPPYAGPYRVIRRSAKFFQLQVGQRVETVSVDRLKPHLGELPVIPAAPPARGRPPLVSGPTNEVHAARSYAAVVAGGGYCSVGTNGPERSEEIRE